MITLQHSFVRCISCHLSRLLQNLVFLASYNDFSQSDKDGIIDFDTSKKNRAENRINFLNNYTQYRNLFLKNCIISLILYAINDTEVSSGWGNVSRGSCVNGCSLLCVSQPPCFQIWWCCGPLIPQISQRVPFLREFASLQVFRTNPPCIGWVEGRRWTTNEKGLLEWVGFRFDKHRKQRVNGIRGHRHLTHMIS